MPASLAATLAVGLRENSRVKMKLRGDWIPYGESILAMIYDCLRNFIWAAYGKGKAPQSIFEALNREERANDPPEIRAYKTPEDFEHERRTLMGG